MLAALEDSSVAERMKGKVSGESARGMVARRRTRFGDTLCSGIRRWTRRAFGITDDGAEQW